jgi:ethanolamine utilization protein EutN
LWIISELFSYEGFDMKLGKVIGNVVSTIKHESFEGIKLLLVQPIDEKFKSTGDPIVAFDMISSSEGQIIFYETSKEAGRVLENKFNPCDAAIMGIVDSLNLEDN